MDDQARKEYIVKRIAKELKTGDVVNLGIGMPTLVANHLEEGVDITLQSENGFIGLGPTPLKGDEDWDLINAGGLPVTILPGGAFFDSSESFCIIRGGHVDVTVLGALEVDAKGNLANWMIPGKLVPGMGGAMDLVVGAKKVIVATLHTAKGEQPKLLKECSLPLTAKGEVDLIVTEMGVFIPRDGCFFVQELNPAYSLEEVQKLTGAPLILAE